MNPDYEFCQLKLRVRRHLKARLEALAEERNMTWNGMAVELLEQALSKPVVRVPAVCVAPDDERYDAKYLHG